MHSVFFCVVGAQRAVLRLFQTLQCTALSVALQQAPTSKTTKIYLAEEMQYSYLGSRTGSGVRMKSCDAFGSSSKAAWEEISGRADRATSALLESLHR